MYDAIMEINVGNNVIAQVMRIVLIIHVADITLVVAAIAEDIALRAKTRISKVVSALRVKLICIKVVANALIVLQENTVTPEVYVVAAVLTFTKMKMKYALLVHLLQLVVCFQKA